jgi:hypothetical protein
MFEKFYDERKRSCFRISQNPSDDNRIMMAAMATTQCKD